MSASNTSGGAKRIAAVSLMRNARGRPCPTIERSWRVSIIADRIYDVRRVGKL